MGHYGETAPSSYTDATASSFLRSLCDSHYSTTGANGFSTHRTRPIVGNTPGCTDRIKTLSLCTILITNLNRPKKAVQSEANWLLLLVWHIESKHQRLW